MFSLSASEFVPKRVWYLTLLLWLWFSFYRLILFFSYRNWKLPKDIFLKAHHNHAILVSITPLKGHFLIPLTPWQAGKPWLCMLEQRDQERDENHNCLLCRTWLFWCLANHARVSTDVAYVIRAYAGKQKETMRVMIWLPSLVSG